MHQRVVVLFLASVGWLAGATVIKVEAGDDLAAAIAQSRRIHREKRLDVVEIVLSAGVHRLTAPLTLGPEDSETKLTAAKGASPVISGGRKITGFHLRPDGCWETKTAGPAFEQLWVNGRMTVRSREPDSGFFRMAAVSEETLEGKARQTVTLADDALHWLRDLKPEALARVQFLAYHKWDNTRRFIEKTDGPSFSTVGSPMKSWNRWDKKSGLVFENLEAGMDEPGEWFLSSEGVLAYRPRPGEDPASAEVTAPLLEKILIIRGTPTDKVRNVEIRGISFQHAGWICPEAGFEPSQAAAPVEAVIQVDHAEKLTIANCEIAHTGIHGLWLRDGCRDNRVSGCYLHDLGAGGVRIGSIHEGRGTGSNTVENCIVRDGGNVFPCAVGIWIGHSGDNVVEHNEISHLPYTGVSIGWRWGYAPSEAKNNRIAFNHIHHIGNGLLSDMGGIYTLGPSEGTVMRNNRIHDIVSYDYGGWGLYNDEGSTGILMENNLVYQTTSGGYHQHYGRENIIHNNIFAFARDQQLQFTRPEDHLSFTFSNNIVLWEKGRLWSGGADGNGRIESENNLYWRTDGGGIKCFGKNFDEWRQAGHDLRSLVTNPGFVDPAAGDFRFSDPVIPEKIAFIPFDTTAAGVRGDPAWRKLAAETPPDWHTR